MILQFSLLIAQLIVVQGLYNCVKIPREKDEFDYYLTNGKIARLVPFDINTMQKLKCTKNTANYLKQSALLKLKIGESIPIINITEATATDDIIELEVFKTTTLQSNFFRKIKNYGEYVNAAIVPFMGRLLMAVPMQAGDNINCNEAKRPDDQIYFRWIKELPFSSSSSQTNNNDNNDGRGGESNSFLNEKSYLNISNEFIAPFPNITLIGQDPRMIVHHSQHSFIISFTNPLRIPFTMGLIEFRYNARAEKVDVVRYYDRIISPINTQSIQKNWCPFYYEDELYFIYSINPLIIYSLLPSNDRQTTAEIFSITNKIDNLYSEYGGELRGGTNALYLPGVDVYLSFYHFATNLPNNPLKTYFLGAYTFTAHPPFQLVSITAYPMMTEQLYSGPWFWNARRKLDYVVFPLCIYFVDHTDEEDNGEEFGGGGGGGGYNRGNSRYNHHGGRGGYNQEVEENTNHLRDDQEIALVFGHNDHTSQIAYINVKSLLDSMISVYAYHDQVIDMH
jgi:hypothetical protein